MKLVGVVLSILSLAFATLPLIRVKSPATLWVLLPNFFGTSWAHYVALVGAAGAILGLASGSILAVVAGLLGCVIATKHVLEVTASHDEELARGLGRDWRARISADAERRMLHRRWGFRVPPAPEARVTRDIAFATVPGTDRELRCDLWRPPPAVPPTGLAIVYLHGSAWCLIDKDVGTRPFFSHLAAQGHVVMDVAYRLCPETDAIGMVADAKRAIVWLKAHAAELGVSPDRVVLMGGSAGGHIALLTAYTSRHVDLTPSDLRDANTSVRAVVSYYGVPDLRAYDKWARRFEPPGGAPIPAKRREPGKFASAMYRMFFGRPIPPENMPPPPPHRQLMGYLVGGLPEEVHGRFDLGSPIHHISRACPLTLHFQAEYDNIVPVESARDFHRALVEAEVPAVYIELPRALHAFDLMFPPLFGPAAQAALYDLERFLACIA